MEERAQGAGRGGVGGPGVTLVLGGGGARGLAHYGVMQVLEGAGIPVDMIVGNSAGALAGAALLQAECAEAAAERTLRFLESPLFRRHGLQFKMREEDEQPPSMVSRMLSGWRRSVAMHLLFRREALFHSRRLTGAIHALVDEQDFESLRVPLKVVALDLADGEEVVLERGDLRQAVVASCSVAGFFPPVEIEGRRVIDSGQADNLPVQVALERGRRPVVAVNLSADIDRSADFKTGIEIMLRSEEIGSRWNTRLRLQQADVHVAPALKGRFWLDFSRPREVVEAGAAAAREAVPRIQELLERSLQGRPEPQRVQPT